MEEENVLNEIEWASFPPFLVQGSELPSVVCGEAFFLGFRKKSDGNSSLLCKDCAVRYALSVLKLQEEHGVGGDLT